MLIWVFGTIYVFIGVLTIFLVLLHSGKGGGLSDMFGGGLGAAAAGSTAMERNLDRRVETLSPVRDPEIVAHLRDVVLAAYLRDTDRAMILDAAGHYSRPDAAAGSFNAMDFLLKQYADVQNE